MSDETERTGPEPQPEAGPDTPPQQAPGPSETLTSAERVRRALRALRVPRAAALPEHSLLIVLGIITGIGGGLGAVAFRWLIDIFQAAFFDGGGEAFGFMGSYYTILLPALGGLLVGPIVHFMAPEAKGHGVPEIMEAVAMRGGRIRARVAIIKSLASSICIGSGGSVGREGPIAQIGAALGSTIAGLLKVSQTRTRMLVACGAAAGIAATFNAPIGGAFFALELLLGRWTAEAFAPVVVASVTGASIGRALFGDVPAFGVPEYGIAGFTELPAFLILGLIAAPLGVIFVRMITYAEDLFESIPIPPYLLPAIGGLFVGFIGLHDPTLYGVGYGKLQELLTHPSLSIGALLILLVLKMLATSLTIGSGGSGGVFSPSLYVGGIAGAAFGVIAHGLFPAMTTEPAAYALTGMAALFAATSHAPITAVLIVFELTADYRMILPLMVACGTSVLTARALYRFSIYNIKLVRRGVHVQLGHDIQALSDMPVANAMRQDFPTVPKDMPVSEVIEKLEETRLHGFPVVNDKGGLAGWVTLSDVRRAGPGAAGRTAGDIATHHLVIAYADDSLNDALRKLGLRDVGHLPVVDRDDHTKLLGVITRQNIISAYNRLLMGRHTHLETTQDEEDFE